MSARNPRGSVHTEGPGHDQDTDQDTPSDENGAGAEIGPFETLEAAVANMEGADEGAIEQAEQVEEVERVMDLDSRIDTEGSDEPEGST